MGEENLGKIEPHSIRPREIIQLDLRGIESKIESLNERFSPLQDRINDLPEEQRIIIGKFTSDLTNAEIKDEEMASILPNQLLPLGDELRSALKEVSAVLSRRTGLERELTPYRKTDFEDLVQNLSARINYDAVFDYYIDQNETLSPQDLLDNTASQLYNLRRYQYEITMPVKKEESLDYYNYRIQQLEALSREWGEKGFLSQEPKGEYEIDQRFGAYPQTERHEVLKNLYLALEQLEKYNNWRNVYQHTLEHRWPFDPSLQSLIRILEDKNETSWDIYKNFEEIDFDPAFIAAAKKYAIGNFEEHRTLGHLPPTRHTLEVEAQRIDAINNDEVVIKTDGFDAPPGMASVVDSQEVVASIRDLLPPDFIHGLRTISHRTKPKKSPKDNPNTETVGAYFPTFDKNGKLEGANIEIYKELFLHENSTSEEQLLTKSEFMGTVWHEFGHNAHHMMRYNELEAWETITADDKTPVAWYVQYAREDSEAKGKREDFADSFRLFITDPALLSVISPPRFQFMYEYFNQRLKPDQQEVFRLHLRTKISISHQVWNNNGLTAEDIKNIYLSHTKGAKN